MAHGVYRACTGRTQVQVEKAEWVPTGGSSWCIMMTTVFWRSAAAARHVVRPLVAADGR